MGSSCTKSSKVVPYDDMKDHRERNDEIKQKDTKHRRSKVDRKDKKQGKSVGKSQEHDAGELTYDVITHFPIHIDKMEEYETFWEEKRKVIPDMKRIHIMDQHAIKTPVSLKSDEKALVEYLVGPAKSDLEKSRVLIRWIGQNIAYDVTYNHSLQKPEDVLRTGVAVCAGYSGLYESLCRIARVQCESISGTSKGGQYYPGAGEGIEAHGHAWNRIRVNNKWYLCDATWAAGSVDGRVFTKSWDEQWFIVNPEIFVNTHLPLKDKIIESDLQMIKYPFEDFNVWDNTIYARPCSKDHDIQPIAPDQAIIRSTDNKIRIRLRCPKPIEYFASLKNVKNGSDIRQNVMIYFVDDIVYIDGRLPGPGVYVLTVCGTIPYLPGKAGENQTFLKYTVKAEGKVAHPAFPAGSQLWGLTPNVRSTDTTINDYTGAILQARDGKTQVSMNLPSTAFCPVIAELRDSQNVDVTKAHVFGERTGKRLKFQILCSSKGEFLFEIWLKTDGASEQYQTPIRFLVQSDMAASNKYLFPEHWSAIWGPNQNIVPFELMVTEPCSATILATEGNGTVKLNLPSPVNINHALFTQSGNEYQHAKSSVYAEVSTGKVCYHLRIPDPGLYKLALSAGSDESTSLEYVAVFLVQVERGWKGPQFPDHHGLWGIQPAGRKFNLKVKTLESSSIHTAPGEYTLEIGSPNPKVMLRLKEQGQATETTLYPDPEGRVKMQVEGGRSYKLTIWADDGTNSYKFAALYFLTCQ